MLPRIACGIFGTVLATIVVSSSAAADELASPMPSCQANATSNSAFTFQAAKNAPSPSDMTPLPDLGIATSDRSNNGDGIRFTPKTMADGTISLMWTYEIPAAWQQQTTSPVTESGFSWTLNGVSQPTTKGKAGSTAHALNGEITGLKNGDVIGYRDHYSFQVNVSGAPGIADHEISGTVRLSC